MAAQEGPRTTGLPPTTSGRDGGNGADDLAEALGQVLSGYRTIVAGDVSTIRDLIHRGQIEQALRALELQRRSLQTAAACMDGVLADATAAREVGDRARRDHTDSKRRDGRPLGFLFLLR